jgi:hypothetical protein
LSHASVPDGGRLLARYGEELADAVEQALGPWVVQAIRHRLPPLSVADTAALAPRLDVAAAEAVADVIPRLRQLLALDVDQQWTNPLALIRQATSYPTAVLAAAGVAPSARDSTEVRLQPDDLYGLTPATFADLGPEVHERGLRWGAAKAYAHLERRRSAPASGESR